MNARNAHAINANATPTHATRMERAMKSRRRQPASQARRMIAACSVLNTVRTVQLNRLRCDANARVFTRLELTNRHTDETESTPLDNEDPVYCVEDAATLAGITVTAAWMILLDGGELAAPGYVLRLA